MAIEKIAPGRVGLSARRWEEGNPGALPMRPQKSAKKGRYEMLPCNCFDGDFGYWDLILPMDLSIFYL